MRILSCLLLCCLPEWNAFAEPVEFGLVPSGGDTKGGAHIGVI